MAVVVGANSPVDDTPNPPGTPLIGYDDIVTAANVSSTTALAGFPISNVGNSATHLIWRAAVNTGAEVITITGDGVKVLDYIGIAAHNLGSNNIPITIVNSGDSPGAVLVASTTLPDDKPAIFRFAPGAYSQIQISLDLSFVPDDGIPQIAVIYCGKLLVLERGIKVDVVHVALPYGRKTSIVNGMSESGNFLGRIVLAESRASRAEFFAFTPEFYRASIDPFLVAAQQNPFFWAWAPLDYPLETGFAWLTTDAQPETSPDHRHVALALDMAGIA